MESALQIALLVVVLVPLAFLIISLVRRSLISRGTGVSVCALRTHDSPRWRSGMMTLSPMSMEWYPFVGLTTVPAYRWVRPTLELGRAVPLEGDPPWLLSGMPALLCVPCHAQPLHGEESSYVVILQTESYMALRSWTESSPPQDMPAGN